MEDSRFKQILSILDEVLQLGDRGHNMTVDTPLLGSIPELDSMAVVAVLTTIEEQFDTVFDDDEISADAFATVGALCRLVEDKIAG